MEDEKVSSHLRRSFDRLGTTPERADSTWRAMAIPGAAKLTMIATAMPLSSLGEAEHAARRIGIEASDGCAPALPNRGRKDSKLSWRAQEEAAISPADVIASEKVSTPPRCPHFPMESSLGRIVWPPENRWQTPQTCPCRLRKKAPHLRQHRADQRNTMDHQKACQNYLKLMVAERERELDHAPRLASHNLYRKAGPRNRTKMFRDLCAGADLAGRNGLDDRDGPKIAG